jgi:hypothetical protein
MPPPDPVAARWPSAPPRRGHYESYFLKAVHPHGAQAVWIRYTVRRPPGERPHGSVWLTHFDLAGAGPRAVKTMLPAPQTGEDDWIRIESRPKAAGWRFPVPVEPSG